MAIDRQMRGDLKNKVIYESVMHFSILTSNAYWPRTVITDRVIQALLSALSGRGEFSLSILTISKTQHK